MANQTRGHEFRQALVFLGLVQSPEFDHFPDFLVIAPPKTGTSWLSQQLSRHPGIFVPPTKEIRYFSFFHRYHNLAWYLSHFKEAGRRLKSEASPNYALLPSSTIRLIHELRPDLKLIYLMRDPVDRAWSQARWDHRLRIGTFAALQTDTDQVADSMWRACFLNPSHVLFGDYLGQLQRWLEVFDRSQVFVGFSEQIQSSPRELLNAICKFLGVDTKHEFDAAGLSERVNAGESRPLTGELRDCLRRIYGGRSRQLVEFLIREFAVQPPEQWNDSLTAVADGTCDARNDGSRVDDLCDRLGPSVDDRQLHDVLDSEEQWSPHVIESPNGWNLVQFRGHVYGVPWSVGPVDFFDPAQLDRSEIFVAATVAEIRERIGPATAEIPSAPPVAPPVLVKEGYRGYNVVLFRGMNIALAQSVGPVDLTRIDEAWLAQKQQSREAFIGTSASDAMRQVDGARGGNEPIE